jgi:AcrR family transcriptional regulator
LKSRPNLLAGEDLPPEPRQKRSVEKRARIKAAALALFGSRGFERTSIEDIALKARVPVGGFYLHFRSKRQLLLALMDDLIGAMARLELRVPAESVRAGLREFLKHAFSGDLRYLGAYRAWQEAALSDAAIARKQRQIRAWTTSRVTNLFGQLARHPEARPGVNLAALGRSMDSFFWTILSEATGAPKVQLESWVDSAAHLIEHALFLDRK